MEELTPLQVKLEENGAELNGYLEIKDLNGSRKTVLPVIIRPTLVRSGLATIFELKQRHKALTIIAGKISGAVRALFREWEINYLDSAGNIFLKSGDFLVFVEGQKNYPATLKPQRRLFTKTGIRIVFHLLASPEAKTYRALAEDLDVSLGSVTHTFQHLARDGFLLKKGKSGWRLIDRKKLLSRWITAYAEQLKPDLLLGRFRFAGRETLQNWTGIDLPADTCWSGEPAVFLLTRFLKPAEWTIYTSLEELEIMKTLHLLPDKKGEVVIYRKFWNEKVNLLRPEVAPVLVVYSDLAGTGEARNMEAAQKIFDEFLEKQF